MLLLQWLVFCLFQELKKRHRKLQKMLRQIQRLEEKTEPLLEEEVREGEGEREWVVKPFTQVVKIGKKQQIFDQLKQLEDAGIGEWSIRQFHSSNFSQHSFHLSHYFIILASAFFHLYICFCNRNKNHVVAVPWLFAPAASWEYKTTFKHPL